MTEVKPELFWLFIKHKEISIMNEEKEKVIYAGAVYEVKYRGERVLHLRSLRDKSLIIHVSVNSVYLKPYDTEKGDENGK